MFSSFLERWLTGSMCGGLRCGVSGLGGGGHLAEADWDTALGRAAVLLAVWQKVLGVVRAL